MKESLAVFGDSFAFSTPYLAEVGQRTIWTDILKEEYTVENYGKSGANLFWSYNAFLKYHQNYDRIVFVITAPGRLWLPEHSIHYSLKNSKFEFCTNYYSTLFHIEEINPIIQPTRLAHKAACDYFLYIQRNDFDQYVQNSIIKDILEIRKDVLLIPAMADSWPNSPYDWCMNMIPENEMKYWNLDYDDFLYGWHKFRDVRCCHMTEENNIIFGKHVLNWLNGDPIILDLNDFLTPESDRYIIETKHLNL